jgi:hypothetical protein
MCFRPDITGAKITATNAALSVALKTAIANHAAGGLQLEWHYVERCQARTRATYVLDPKTTGCQLHRPPSEVGRYSVPYSVSRKKMKSFTEKCESTSVPARTLLFAVTVNSRFFTAARLSYSGSNSICAV